MNDSQVNQQFIQVDQASKLFKHNLVPQSTGMMLTSAAQGHTYKPYCLNNNNNLREATVGSSVMANYLRIALKLGWQRADWLAQLNWDGQNETHKQHKQILQLPESFPSFYLWHDDYVDFS